MIVNMIATVAKKKLSNLSSFLQSTVVIVLLYDSHEQSKTEVYLITIIKYLFFEIIVSK